VTRLRKKELLKKIISYITTFALVFSLMAFAPTAAPFGTTPAEASPLTVTVTLMLNASDPQPYAEIKLEAGGYCREPVAPDRAYYPPGMLSFLGWYEKPATAQAWEPGFNFQGTPITRDLTLYARFNDKHLVKFMDAYDVVAATLLIANGGTLTAAAVSEVANQIASPIPGYFFQHWYRAGDPSESSLNYPLAINGNLTLKPKFIQQYMLVFVSEGSQTPVRIYGTNEPTVAPPTPTREGYTFNRWVYHDGPSAGMPFVFGSVLQRDTYLLATWTPAPANYTVVYWLEKADFSGTPVPGTPGQYLFAYSETRSGMTGAMTNVTGMNLPPSNHNNYTGLRYSTFQRADNAMIKGDGSTVVNVYSRRNVYTIDFIQINSYYQTTMRINGVSYPSNGPRYTIKVKYEQDISRIFPNQSITSFSPSSFNYYGYIYSFAGWLTPANTTTNPTEIWSGDYPAFTQMMLPRNPASNGYTMTGNWQPYVIAQRVNHWVEPLPGETGQTSYYQGRPYILNLKYSHTFYYPNAGTLAPNVVGARLVSAASTPPGTTHNYYYDRLRYKLEFNTMGGSYIPPVQGIMFEERLAGKRPADPTKALNGRSYVFAGWYLDPYYSNAFDFNTAIMPASDLMIYAKWDSVPFTVNFYDSTAPGAQLISVQYAEIGDLVRAPYAPGQIVPGKGELINWLYKANVGNTERMIPYYLGLPINGNLNLYANWQADSYRVTYSAGAGTGTPPVDLDRYRMGVYAMVMDGAGLQQGQQVFAGWRINGQGPTYYPGGLVAITGNIPFVARYINPVEAVKVVYHANHAGPGGAHTYTMNVSLNDDPLQILTAAGAAALGFDRPGYKMTYWTNTQVDASPIFNLGGTYSFAALGMNNWEIHLYAQWETIVGPPTKVEALGGDRKITLLWDQPQLINGHTIASYEIKVDNGPWVNYPLASITYNAVVGKWFVVFLGLDNNTEYTFQIRAITTAGLVGPPFEIKAKPDPIGDVGGKEADLISIHSIVVKPAGGWDPFEGLRINDPRFERIVMPRDNSMFTIHRNFIEVSQDATFVMYTDFTYTIETNEVNRLDANLNWLTQVRLFIKVTSGNGENIRYYEIVVRSL